MFDVDGLIGRRRRCRLGSELRASIKEPRLSNGFAVGAAPIKTQTQNFCI